MPSTVTAPAGTRLTKEEFLAIKRRIDRRNSKRENGDREWTISRYIQWAVSQQVDRKR